MTNKISVRRAFALAFVLAYAGVAVTAIYFPTVIWALLLIVPLHLVYLQNIWQRQHTVLRNFPLLGYLRYFLESIRPELRQYFFESDLNGKPFSRRQRSIVYQRAKNVRQTVPFGMQQDSGKTGYEWLAHTMFPAQVKEENLRVRIGSSRCQVPYFCSIYNIAAMSYGALSKTAIQALNGGARLGGFAHNTGEGGISPYHLTEGGDLIWQIGTGYFGCRDAKGEFSPVLFQEQAAHPSIKMIEVKISQGAKPGLGGILPAAKNTPEIAAIRRVRPYTTVVSPAGHSAFHDQASLLQFLDRLRVLAEGKPIGIKICIGDRPEFEKLCQEMQRLQLYPDFITIDGAEGGTGAAPLEFADSVGMPLYDALPFVHRKLRQYHLRQEVKIMAAGKIVTGLDIIKAIALGADACYSARGMMFALGCLQALQCDSGRCPVGIATQEPNLFKGLDVQDKKVRVANFHRHTILATIELMEACGFATLAEINPAKIFRRMDQGETKSFRDIYFNTPAAEKTNAPNYRLNLN